MQCRIPGCPGEYEERRLVDAHRFQGRLIVIDGVPADICSFCGDTLFRPDTAETLERMVRNPPAPVGTVPLYQYPVADVNAVVGEDQPAGMEQDHPVGVRKP